VRSAARVSFLSIDQCRDVRGVAVVVDVLRAFTTAAWAFERGVDRIVLIDDLDAAIVIKARLRDALALKDGEPLAGFDLTNSPAQMRETERLAGRTIVQCTTAGTVGAVAARGASSLFCASFVCAGATAAAVRAAGPGTVAFVVTGDGGAAEEDRACAEYIAALSEGRAADPRPYLERALRSRAASVLAERVAGGQRGVDARDVAMCLEVDRLDFAMQARDEDGLLTLRRFTQRRS
jgi:2-phosphosulfolactate phosphatase